MSLSCLSTNKEVQGNEERDMFIRWEVGNAKSRWQNHAVPKYTVLDYPTV